jgi:hypothetical protein
MEAGMGKDVEDVKEEEDEEVYSSRRRSRSSKRVLISYEPEEK